MDVPALCPQTDHKLIKESNGMLTNIPEYITAAGALGTASYAVVDGSKAVRGGVSNHGFSYIRTVAETLWPKSPDIPEPLKLASAVETLQANWLNGSPLADQKAIAKTLVKLCLSAETAPHFAAVTGVNPEILTGVATKLTSGEPMTQAETDVFGRFDLVLSSFLDKGYQRADQSYRNKAKAWSMAVSVVLAFLGGWTINSGTFGQYIFSADIGKALLTGLLATPLAPVAKDLSSALSAGVKAFQLVRK
jgi:hypothetical protein